MQGVVYGGEAAQSFLTHGRCPGFLFIILQLAEDVDELPDAAYRQWPSGVHHRFVIGEPRLSLCQLFDGRLGSNDLRDSDVIGDTNGPRDILPRDACHGMASHVERPCQ
jgi:hypothetical protein